MSGEQAQDGDGVECPSWVNLVVLTVHRSLPVYPNLADIFSVRRHVSNVPGGDMARLLEMKEAAK
jgi:hypothetical protein